MRMIAMVVAASVCLMIAACEKCGKENEGGTSGEAASGETPGAVDSEQGKLEVTDLQTGSGAEAVDGKKVSVHYTGTLTDGTKFDSSKDRGVPFSFYLGAGRVIAGWEQGIKGMKVGGKRKLVIPSHLAYGDSGVKGVIPPKATLVFEVELLEVGD